MYDSFDFLMTEPVLEKVRALRDENCLKFNAAIKEAEECSKQKNQTKKNRYTNIALRHAAILHLCEFFLLNRESHDTHLAIMTLENLNAKELELVEGSEFEAAALIRDEASAIREYLANRNKKNGSETTKEGCDVSFLRPDKVGREPVQRKDLL